MKELQTYIRRNLRPCPTKKNEGGIYLNEHLDEGLIVGHGQAEVARARHLVQVRILRPAIRSNITGNILRTKDGIFWAFANILTFAIHWLM